MLCDGGLWAERTIHGAGRESRESARNAVRHDGNCLRVLGRVQAIALSDSIYWRCPLRGLGGAAVLQRRRRGVAARSGWPELLLRRLPRRRRDESVPVG